MSEKLTEPAKLLLLAALLAKDRIISNNGKAFIKELILRRDPRITKLLRKFESKEAADSAFLEQIHELIQDEAMSMYNDLFADTSLEVGKTLSKGERDEKNLENEKSLIYGEVEFKSFYRVLRKINPQPGLVFYDLGSGTGKAVFLARLTQDFSKCIGIEILQSLHNQARKIVDRYNKDYRDRLCVGQNQHASVYAGSILELNWLDGDVVFANSTCFDDDLMRGMAKLAEGLKPGAIFVTFTKGLNSPAFEVLEKKRYKMSWGPATVFIHRRLLHNGKPIGPAKLNTLPSDAAEYNGEEEDEEEDDDDDADDDDDYDEEEEEEDDDDDIAVPSPSSTASKVLSPAQFEFMSNNADYVSDDDDDDEDAYDYDDDEDEEDDDEDVDYSAYYRTLGTRSDSKVDSPPRGTGAYTSSAAGAKETPPRNSPSWKASKETPPSQTRRKAAAETPPSQSKTGSAGKSTPGSGGKNSIDAKKLPSPLSLSKQGPYSYNTVPFPAKSSPTKSPAGGSEEVDTAAPSPYRYKSSGPSALMTSPASLRAREEAIASLNSPQDSALLRRKAARHNTGGTPP